MDINKNTQSKRNQSSSSTRTSEPASETSHEYQESGNIQEVEVISSREQETKEANGCDTNILKTNPERCDLDINSNCKQSNSVCSEEGFPSGDSHRAIVVKTTGASKSNIHLLKRCSVVLNRCDEKTPKADALPDIKPQIIRQAGNGKFRNVRFAEGKEFRKKMIDSDAFVAMGTDNECQCTNMDVGNSDFFKEKRSQVNNCKDSSDNYVKRSTNVKSAKSAQKERICTEVSEGRLENDNVLLNPTGEEIKKIHWKCKSSSIRSDQVSVINASKKELTNKNKAFPSNTKSNKTCAIPKITPESALRHKIAARRNRSSRRSDLKKHVGKEMNEDLEITEIISTDPLLGPPPSNILSNSKETGKLGNFKNNAIVVNNTEQLLQIASRKGIKRKKEPTLVIIDTNSILSGKGAVPISQISLTGSLPHSSVVTGYSVLPSASGSWNNLTSVTPSQTVLQSFNQLTFSASDKSNTSCSQISSLTASTVFIIDTPSFIVPRLYEQPPKITIKKYIEQLQREIETPECTSKSNCLKDNSKNGMKTVNTEENTNPIQNKKRKKCDVSDRHIDESHSSINDEVNANHTIDKKNTSTFCNENAINKDSTISPDPSVKESTKVDKKLNTKDQEFFSSSLGDFFIQIGLDLVKEYINTDPKHLSKEDHSKFVEKNQCNEFPLNSLDCRIEDNQPFHFKQKKCGYCNFQTESCLVMSHHLETPHLFNNVYKCNFCNFIIENRSQIVYHMIMFHDIRLCLECAPAPYQCPNCPFEDKSKSKLNSHKVSCLKKNKPDRNQEPPIDWEPPAKVRHLMQNPVSKRGKSSSTYQMNSIGVRQLLPKLPPNSAFHSGISAGLHVPASTDQVGVIQSHNSTSKHVPVKGMWQRPNISITPLPNTLANKTLTSSAPIALKQGSSENSVSLLNKVQKLNICEICDFKFVDFESLQIHLRDTHHVKFSKKATYSTPSLGCQKCPLRFFTDQGLERHLLGAHGLVTASFQEAAKNETDGGHCPICTKVFQWKLLEHMCREHKMSLKAVNISYKCTLCTTVTFDKYKQFEDHVFSVHSLSKKKNSAVASAPVSGDVLKSLTKNNEITIISHQKRSRSKNNGKTTNTISLIQQRKKVDVNVQQFKIKDIVERLEEKEPRNNLLSAEEINIDSSCEEEKCVDKEKNVQNNDEKEYNSLKDSSNYSHKSRILLMNNHLLQDKKKIATKNNNNNNNINEDTQTSSSTVSTIHLSEQTHESCEENGKSCGFLDSNSPTQRRNEIKDNNPSSAKEAPYQHVYNDKSSTNECEMLNNFSYTDSALKIGNKTNQERECRNETSDTDDSAFVYKNKDSEYVPQPKMKCLSVDCNKLPEHVEIIDLDDSPTKEKIIKEDRNSEISENSASINEQKDKNSKKNSENQILLGHQTADDTSNKTAKLKKIDNESVSEKIIMEDRNSEISENSASINEQNDSNSKKNSENQVLVGHQTADDTSNKTAKLKKIDNESVSEKIIMEDRNSEISENSASINEQNDNNSKKNSENQVLVGHHTADDTSNKTAKLEKIDNESVSEKIIMEERNSEISENSASINEQNDNNSKKNSENQVLEGHQTADDTSNKTAKLEKIDNESVLSHTNLDDSPPNPIPSIPKINEEMNSSNDKILPEDDEGIQVIQLDGSHPGDKKEIEETVDILSK